MGPASPIPGPTFPMQAATDEYDNLNDEYVVLKNTGNSNINLEGWTLEDEADHTYTFPNFNLDAGSTVTIHTGSGDDTSTDLYWGSGTTVWNNAGDTTYLNDWLQCLRG